MCQRTGGERKPEIDDSVSDDPIWRMREPPGALGDIVRRMKRQAVLKQSAGRAPAIETSRRTESVTAN